MWVNVRIGFVVYRRKERAISKEMIIIAETMLRYMVITCFKEACKGKPENPLFNGTNGLVIIRYRHYHFRDFMGIGFGVVIGDLINNLYPWFPTGISNHKVDNTLIKFTHLSKQIRNFLFIFRQDHRPKTMRQRLTDREKTALVFLGKVIFEDKVESDCSD